MDIVRFGLIGCGRVAPRHAESLAVLPRAQLVAVADVCASRAQRFAEQYQADSYTDHCALLDRPDLDVVSICTPSGLHAQMAIDALHAGKHVIVEKPIALSLSDADRMIATAAAMKRRLCVVLQHRFNRAIQDLRRIVDEGRLGRLLLGNATVRWYRPQEYYEDDWHGMRATGGGALVNQSIHHIDALQWFMGQAESVFAFTGTLAHRMEAEDTGVAVVRFAGGGLGSIEGSTIAYPENLEGSLALFGEQGSVKIGGTALNRKVLWKVAGELEHEREGLECEGLECEGMMQDQLDPPSVYGTSHRALIADMLDAVLTDRQPVTHGAEGRNSLALVLAIYESARTGLPVRVDS